VRIVSTGVVERREWTPDEFGLDAVNIADVAVANAADSAAIIRDIFSGVEGPAQRLVVANAAAGLLAAEKADSLKQGVDMAAAALRDGRALHVLRRLQALKR
jgi:anthranilate phosphoribosyltransferase